MANAVGVIVDGVWTQVPVTDGYHAVAVTGDEVDQIVVLLSQIVLKAQSLSPQDQRRVRDFVHAASSMLAATTALNKSDQASFETALRDAARRF